MDEEDLHDEYVEEIDDMGEDDEYDEDEDKDQVYEENMNNMNKYGMAPHQVIGNQFYDSKGRPQSAKVQANNFGIKAKNFYPVQDEDKVISQPMQAYQYGDALNIIRNYSGNKKSKRPMSASNMGRVGRNGIKDGAVINTLTAQNSKLPSEISYMDIKRLKPRRIDQDKEKLYEQVIKYKMQMNVFKKENLKLRTQLKFLEKEQNEREDIIEDLVNNNEVTTIGRLGNVVNNKK